MRDDDPRSIHISRKNLSIAALTCSGCSIGVMCPAPRITVSFEFAIPRCIASETDGAADRSGHQPDVVRHVREQRWVAEGEEGREGDEAPGADDGVDGARGNPGAEDGNLLQPRHGCCRPFLMGSPSRVPHQVGAWYDVGRVSKKPPYAACREGPPKAYPRP